jgi:hypothetical protein
MSTLTFSVPEALSLAFQERFSREMQNDMVTQLIQDALANEDLQMTNKQALRERIQKLRVDAPVFSMSEIITFNHANRI